MHPSRDLLDKQLRESLERKADPELSDLDDSPPSSPAQTGFGGVCIHTGREVVNMFSPPAGSLSSGCASPSPGSYHRIRSSSQSSSTFRPIHESEDEGEASRDEHRQRAKHPRVLDSQSSSPPWISLKMRARGVSFPSAQAYLEQAAEQRPSPPSFPDITDNGDEVSEVECGAWACASPIPTLHNLPSCSSPPVVPAQISGEAEYPGDISPSILLPLIVD